MRRRLEPGDRAALFLLAEAFVIDLWLIRRGDRTISTCTRSRRAAKVGVLYFAWHLCVVSRFDPLQRLDVLHMQRKVS